MKKILIAVDLQNDFVSGALGTAEAEAIVPRAAEKIRRHEGPVLVTMDTHGEDYLSTAEGKKLPVVHCVRGTPGWELDERIREALAGKDAVILENIGNLVCPAEFDVGADLRIAILSVPEGDDKPLKYPLMFEKSDALVITKTDALPYFTFDREACENRVRKLNPGIRLFPVSAKTGEGMQELEDWLAAETAALKKNKSKAGERA